MYREGGLGKLALGKPATGNPGRTALVWQTHAGVVQWQPIWPRGRKHKNREVRQSGLPNSGMFSDAR